MFDTVLGLPMHVLVLHAAVIAIPAGALGAAAVHLRPAWRGRWLAPAVAVNLALLVLAFVTVQAGQELQADLDPSGAGSLAAEHEDYGQALLWVLLALAAVSVITLAASWAKSFAPAALTGLGAVVAALAIAAAAMTVVTGHSGSESHWGYLDDQQDATSGG